MGTTQILGPPGMDLNFGTAYDLGINDNPPINSFGRLLHDAYASKQPLARMDYQTIVCHTRNPTSTRTEICIVAAVKNVSI